MSPILGTYMHML